MKSWQTLDGKPPRIIAHRGASGLRPEHTSEAYRLAIAQGADIIEPDLVPTRDGVLMARHERGLSLSTDVALHPEFADRCVVDARGNREWFVDDFNAEEIARLRALQSFPGRSRVFDGAFAIPNFDEVVAIARKSWQSGRTTGIYPEIKHPTELMARGIDSTALLLETIRSEGLEGLHSPIWVQCFELASLRRVHEYSGNPVFALFDEEAIGSVGWLHSIRASAPWLNGIAIPKAAVIGTHAHSDLVLAAHNLGWQVHVWTLRDDAVMPAMSTIENEYSSLFKLGVDALFCDFPDSAIRARSLFATNQTINN